MRYGFLCIPRLAHPQNGLRHQALMWKAGLERLGHSVELVSNWCDRSMTNYDVLIAIGIEAGMWNFFRYLHLRNPNIISAPLIDPRWGKGLYKFFVKYWGSNRRTGLSSKFHDVWECRPFVKHWLVRSEQERTYVHYCAEVPNEQITKVPLHCRIPYIAAEDLPEKEPFCLHVSRLEAPNKNVPRLVAAAKKYGFPLKLGGVVTPPRRQWFSDLIAGADNIEYLGPLSEEQLLETYKRAKVFAMPSIKAEGVGMVALEAAAYGCEIVLTTLPGPREYFEERAILVNPASVDEIGKGVMRALNEGHAQPLLKQYVDEQFSEQRCCSLLHEAVVKALGK